MEESFRQFYNHTIYPELYRMERRRKRLLWMLFGIGSFSLLLIVLGWATGLKGVVMLLVLPFIAYLGWLGRALGKFVELFKPKIVKLILDFIDNQMSYDTLHYDSQKGISKKMFNQSGLFATKADDYQSEDYIKGRIGDVDFELSEVRVREMAGMQKGMRPVFSGVFFKATFNRPIRGALLILPRSERARLNKVIKKFNLKHGVPMNMEGLPEFDEVFMVYRTVDASVSLVVSATFCESILNYYRETGEKPVLSIFGDNAYALLPSSKDMLEPNLFTSNLRFDKIDEFYRDIQMLLDLIEELDIMF